MITLSRSLLQTVRQVALRLFRPKTPHQGEQDYGPRSPQTLFCPAPEGTFLTVRCAGRQLTRLVSTQRLPTPLSCDWDWLQEVAATSGELNVTLADDKLVLRWDDNGFPQTRSLEFQIEDEPAAATPALGPVDIRLIASFAAAREATDTTSTRYSLGCIQLDGTSGTVNATDGRQLLRFSGFQFPWSDRAILVPATEVFAAAAIARAKSLSCGANEQELVLQADDWTIRLMLAQKGRFPQVESVINRFGTILNRVYVDPEDLEFFTRHFKRIPGAKQDNTPVTLDLNGHVDLTAAGDEQQQPLRMRLSRSTHLGKPARCSVNRHLLHRAAKLRTREWRRFGENQPLHCLGDQLTYVIQPLSDVDAPNDSAGIVEVDSRGGS